MAIPGAGRKQAVALRAVLALGYQAWRSRWLWGLPEAEADARQVAAVAGDPVGAELDRYLSRLAAYGYSGSALVARGGPGLLPKGEGPGGSATGRPFTAAPLVDVPRDFQRFA